MIVNLYLVAKLCLNRVNVAQTLVLTNQNTS